MGPICVNPACPCLALASTHLVAWPRPLVPNLSSTSGLLPPPSVPPLSTRGASSSRGGSQTCSPRSPLWEGHRAPSPFTEFSGFVLSALAWKPVLVYVGSLSHLLSPVLPSAFLVLLELGLCCSPVPQHCQKSVFVLVGVGPAPGPLGPVPCPVSGAVISLWWLRRKRREAFSALQLSVAFTSQSSKRRCHLSLVLGPK